MTSPTSPSQIEIFDSAMKLFHARDFGGARKLFEQVATGPNRDVSHAARQHILMCDQRIARQKQPELRTPEDYYHYAVALINQRQLDTAQQSLKRALELAPKADYLHYAMTLTLGLKGDLEGAAQHLEQAIRLEPRNRVIARNDADFLEFGKKSPLRELVFEKKDSQ